MKNPLNTFSKAFQITLDAIPFTGAITLEFCYDHVSEDFPMFNPNETLILRSDDFQRLRIQETE